jgi:hypothetical protein
LVIEEAQFQSYLHVQSQYRPSFGAIMTKAGEGSVRQEEVRELLPAELSTKWPSEKLVGYVAMVLGIIRLSFPMPWLQTNEYIASIF